MNQPEQSQGLVTVRAATIGAISTLAGCVVGLLTFASGEGVARATLAGLVAAPSAMAFFNSIIK